MRSVKSVTRLHPINLNFEDSGPIWLSFPLQSIPHIPCLSGKVQDFQKLVIFDYSSQARHVKKQNILRRSKRLELRLDMIIR